MTQRIWGVCSECNDTIQCRKDTTGYTVLNHKTPDGVLCDGSGCSPDAVIDEAGQYHAIDTEKFDAE